MRIRIDKATHGRHSRDEVDAMVADLVHWGRVQGFSHGEVCLDVGYLDPQNPRAVVREW